MSDTVVNPNPLTLRDLNTENPRWCAGCGDYGIIAGVKRLMVDEQMAPHNIVNVSGIGCSGRASFYINTYGVHAIHGRANTVALGLALMRPDLNIFIHSGDGDALSIGGNHLIHALNKNFNCVFLMYDNEMYALTKNQTSPTTRKGHPTNTQPTGTYLRPFRAVSLALGCGASFIATTADWMPDHMLSTIRAAYHHRGFSFVHISQRCPHFDPENFDHKSSAWFSFLQHPQGIEPDKRLKDKTQTVLHDPSNAEEAFKFSEDGRRYFGLYYRNEQKPCYDDLLRRQITNAKPGDHNAILDRFEI